jgi:hypothetical protein
MSKRSINTKSVCTIILIEINANCSKMGKLSMADK